MLTSLKDLAKTIISFFCFLFPVLTAGVAFADSKGKTPTKAHEEDSKMSFFSKPDSCRLEHKPPDSLSLCISNAETLSRSF